MSLYLPYVASYRTSSSNNSKKNNNNNNNDKDKGRDRKRDEWNRKGSFSSNNSKNSLNSKYVPHSKYRTIAAIATPTEANGKARKITSAQERGLRAVRELKLLNAQSKGAVVSN